MKPFYINLYEIEGKSCNFFKFNSYYYYLIWIILIYLMKFAGIMHIFLSLTIKEIQKERLFICCFLKKTCLCIKEKANHVSCEVSKFLTFVFYFTLWPHKWRKEGMHLKLVVIADVRLMTFFQKLKLSSVCLKRLILLKSETRFLNVFPPFGFIYSFTTFFFLSRRKTKKKK